MVLAAAFLVMLCCLAATKFTSDRDVCSFVEDAEGVASFLWVGLSSEWSPSGGLWSNVGDPETSGTLNCWFSASIACNTFNNNNNITPSNPKGWYLHSIIFARHKFRGFTVNLVYIHKIFILKFLFDLDTFHRKCTNEPWRPSHKNPFQVTTHKILNPQVLLFVYTVLSVRHYLW